MRPKSKSLPGSAVGLDPGMPLEKETPSSPEVPCLEGGQLLAGVMLERIGVPPAPGRGCGVLRATAGDGAGMELREPLNSE